MIMPNDDSQLPFDAAFTRPEFAEALDAIALGHAGQSTDLHDRGVVYLMRGLPSCGKSTRARELAGEKGVVVETDEFFYTQVGDSTKRYTFDAGRLQEARDWNYGRFVQAIDANVLSIAVDRGNGLNLETQRYAKYAVARGYDVVLAEPNSPWWHEIRVLLKYKEHTMPVLEDWAEKLAQRNRSTHRTPAKTILRWMMNWRTDVTVRLILDYKAPATKV
ncbi:MAG: AAA family ATPase [Planctomycetales bacterium]|nr:AAA family ATPase [Planctomycetales bacterium]